MRYIRQFCVILGITWAGEILNYYIPLPVPAGVYGMVLMLLGLYSGVIKTEMIKETGEFLVEVMPLMFIPAGVGLLESWDKLEEILLPVFIITVVSMFAVMAATGKITDHLLKEEEEGWKD